MPKRDKQIVRLTGSDLKRAANVGMNREDAKTIPNRFRITHENEAALNKYIADKKYRPHFLGIIGEIAYAKFIGGEINEEIYHNHGDDGRGDVGNVEVKASTWRGDDIELKVTQREYNTKQRPDKYVLVRVSEKTPSIVELVGEVSVSRFEAEKKIKQYRPDAPINYIMSAEELDEVACA
jgi:hypothetical protein